MCPLGEAELLLDFEKEVVGGLTMKVRCEGAAHITVIYDEWPESAMRREPYESTWYTGLRDDFDLSEGEHTLVSEGRRGFRYAGIFASGSCTELLSVEASNGSWPHEQRGFFRCSDEKLNRIWDISVATLRACMQSFYEDGVKRDGLLWIGDTRWMFNSGYYALGDHELARRSLLMIRDSQLENGAIPACAFAGGGHQHGVDGGISYMGDVLDMLNRWVIINYVSEYICAIEDYVHLTGDLTILSEILDSARHAMEFLTTASDLERPGYWKYEEHISKPDEYGITYFQEFECGMNPTNNYGSKGGVLLGMYGAARALQRLAQRGGRQEMEQWADQTAQHLDEHLEKYYRDPISGQYLDTMGQPRSEILQYAAIQAYLAGKDDPSGMTRMLRSIMPNWGYMMTCKMVVLMKQGYVHEALEEIRQGWGKFLDHDSLTCWERLDAPDFYATHYYNPIPSACHGWTAGPASLLPEWITGVHVDGDGFTSIRVEPELDTLTWAESSICTPVGTLFVRVERQGPELSMYLDLPEGIEKCVVKLGREGNFTVTTPGFHVLSAKR